MDQPIILPWWKKPAMTPVYIGGGVVLGLLLLTAIFWSTRERSFRTPLVNVTISTVEKSVFHDFVPLHGKVVPKDTIYLDALQGGQVEQVLVQAGDQVTQGQPLIKFRNTDLELSVIAQEGNLAQSINQLQQQETALEATRVANAKTLADIQYNITRLERLVPRYEKLLAEGAIAPSDAEKTRDELDHYKELLPLQLEANRRQESLRLKVLPTLQPELEGLQKSLEVTRRKMDDLTVRAPVTGRITAIDLKIGEIRRNGERLAEIIPPTGFKITADIDEYYLARVRAGQSADIDVDGARYKLRVARVYPQVKNGVFQADFTFDGKAPPNMTQGAAVEGKLSLGADNSALILSSGAFLEASGGDYVFVLDAGEGSAHRRRVKLGRRNVEQVEVLQGLSAGEKVITSDYSTYDKIERIDLTK
jgi:HlyD family secretion protein